ncbi:MipA/OmpV family protein [Cetobacterium sp.]|uniref:MipA/OmpV family protein n=1 Tax=Cetobacterium sp. TaxID=2071632 RepID=UPI003F3D6136
MKKIILSILALTLSTAAVAENKIGIGAGAGFSNSVYSGAESKAYPLPLLDINYGDFYAKGITFGYNFFKGEDLALSVYLDPMAGFPIKSEDIGEDYTNIEDRKFMAMIGLRADLNSGIAGIKAGTTVQFGEHGSEAKISLFKPYSINDKLILVPSIYAKGFSGDYSDYYFGVSDDEANKSESDKLTTSYKAETAFSVGTILTTSYKYNDKISLVGILGVEQFSNEITDSPITSEKPIFIASIGAQYFF